VHLIPDAGHLGQTQGLNLVPGQRRRRKAAGEVGVEPGAFRGLPDAGSVVARRKVLGFKETRKTAQGGKDRRLSDEFGFVSQNGWLRGKRREKRVGLQLPLDLRGNALHDDLRLHEPPPHPLPHQGHGLVVWSM
jgi:hypothetical protein